MSVRRHFRVWLAIASIASCRADGGGSGDAMGPDGGEGGSGSGSSGGPDPQTEVDSCALGPTIQVGRTIGTLRNKTTDRGGACGMGGPDAFYRFESTEHADVHVSAVAVGFVPRVGVLPDDCIGDFALVGLACGSGLPVWVTDVAPATTLLVAIGTDADDPALATPVPEGMPDPLAFALDVQLRTVLDPGDPCEPRTLGRCITGTACVESVEDGLARCTAVPGDTCATAEPIVLGAGIAAIVIDPLAPATDDHAHSCTGGHRPERVYRLELPESLDASAQLLVQTDAADVGLAVRGPGCEQAEERACALPGPSGASATVAGLAQAIAPGNAVYVFVELPPVPAGEDSLTVDVVLSPP